MERRNRRKTNSRNNIFLSGETVPKRVFHQVLGTVSFSGPMDKFQHKLTIEDSSAIKTSRQTLEFRNVK